MKYVFQPKGICPSQIHVEVEGDVIGTVRFCGGCNGNGKGVAALVKGRELDDVIERCRDITCGARPTSCPAQLAMALEQIKAGKLAPESAEPLS